MYSNSRIETFEQCPRKYKFRYIDNVRADTEGVEAFVGKRVHEALEKLYRDLRYTKLNSLDEVFRFYEGEWEKNWHGKVQVIQEGLTPGHYFALGRQCLADYYKRYHPFDQGKTLGLEERIQLKLTEGEKSYTIQGFIDRLTWVPETACYEIHDYKTGSHVLRQDEADQDRQLALYQLGIMQRWPDARNFKLIWHYLAADKEVVSVRSAAHLDALQKEVLALIHQIEDETKLGRWQVRTSALCAWCEYKPLCPAYKHPTAMEALSPNAYFQDSGVQLTQKYAALEAQKSDLLAQVKAVELEQKKVEDAVLRYAEQEDVTTLDGPEHRLQVKTEEEWKVPRKSEDALAWELLRSTLKSAGRLEEVSTVNGNMLRFAMKRGKWPEALVQSVTGLIEKTVKKTLSLVRK